MKLLKKMGLTLLVTFSFFCITTQNVSAEEVFEFVDDNATTGVAETGISSSGREQRTEKQQRQYNQAMSGEGADLEVGESMVIGSDADGIISITCVSSNTDLTRTSWKTSYKSYDINKTILGVQTTLAHVDLECTWYADGIDGYISNLKGTYTEKNSAWLCSWDDYKVANPYGHALWLNLNSLSSSYSIMLAANYNPFNNTLSFEIQA